MKIPALITCLLTTALAIPTMADNVNFLDLSLEDLLTIKVDVPAALTQLTRLETPAATTVITAADIRLTPARNLYDLIEVYVPGAIWMNHELGPHLGIRGNIANRNYKYLLLVNGRVMNNSAYAGASSELEQWDLSDIERVEIISGPGSVTYGPGAVAGVISITTRAPGSDSGTLASLGYTAPYNSRSIALSNSVDGDGYKLFAHASIVRSTGIDAPSFQVTSRNEAGFVGSDILKNTEPLDYFGDFKNNPQVKLQLDMEFANDWRWWNRYTEQGSNWFGNETKSSFDGELINEQGVRDRQVTSMLEHKTIFSEQLTLSSQAIFGSYDFERRTGNVRSLILDNPLNYQVNFAENNLTARNVLNWQADAGAQVALGLELQHNHYGKGWGDSEKDMRLGESGEIINGPDSHALSTGNGGSANNAVPAIYVGDGWSTNGLAIFSEANFTFGAGQRLLLSGRADKQTYSDWVYSPRAVWISPLAEGHVLKFIAQRSSRLNTAAQMYSNALYDVPNRPEQLDSFELAYAAQPTKNLSFNFSMFHNNAEVIAFQLSDNTNRLVGHSKLHGIEGELRYSWEHSNVGVNFSYVKQLSWQLAPGVITSGISYADYNLPISRAGVQQGWGNDLNNWPNEALKFFANYDFTNRLRFHVDARWFSKMQGAQDGLTAMQKAVVGTSSEAAFNAALERINDEEVYSSDYRADSLIEYSATDAMRIQLFVQNLLGRDGKRYSYDDAGNTNPAPRRVRFVEEPLSYGMRVYYHF